MQRWIIAVKHTVTMHMKSRSMSKVCLHLQARWCVISGNWHLFSNCFSLPCDQISPCSARVLSAVGWLWRTPSTVSSARPVTRWCVISGNWAYFLTVSAFLVISACSARVFSAIRWLRKTVSTVSSERPVIRCGTTWRTQFMFQYSWRRSNVN